MFSYPIDTAAMLKNRKSLKNRLLAQSNTKRIKIKVAVLAGSTVNDIVEMLDLFLLSYGIEAKFYCSDYGLYREEALFASPKLLAFQPNIIYIHTSNRNIGWFPTAKCDGAFIEEQINSEYRHFEEIWESLKSKFDCTIIQNNFEMPYYRTLGNKDASSIHGRVNYIVKLNQKFYEYAQSSRNFYINDINYLSAYHGLEKWSDPLYWNMYKYSVAVPLIPELSCSIANIIKSSLGKNKKALVLDLDNTLWGGVIGDDGVEGILVGNEHPVGQAYAEFQSYIKSLKDIGVMLAVCSKNDYDIAVSGLEYNGNVLKKEDFQIIKANWNSKAQNILEIAEELNIFPDSLVFVDDNPAERKLVKDEFPDMEVPFIDDVENYIKILDRNSYFEVTEISADDLNRNEMYSQNRRRKEHKAKYKDYGEYLDSLEMTAVIDVFRRLDLQRITQLANKTNQFNLTSKRYTLAEIEAVCVSENHICISGRLTDKFGDNGIVSAIIGEIKNDGLHIDLWIMSCRVLKRDLEKAMLDVLCAESLKRSITSIFGYYHPSEKNALVIELFSELGFKLVNAKPNGETVWKLAIEYYADKNRHILIKRGDTIETDN